MEMIKFMENLFFEGLLMQILEFSKFRIFIMLSYILVLLKHKLLLIFFN
jgi:hypothetical protein